MENGYDLAKEMFDKIGKNEEHEATIEDALRIISFWGFNEEAPVNSKIGFVCYCAREKIKKVLIDALVFDDFDRWEELEKQMENRRRDKVHE